MADIPPYATRLATVLGFHDDDLAWAAERIAADEPLRQFVEAAKLACDEVIVATGCDHSRKKMRALAAALRAFNGEAGE